MAKVAVIGEAMPHWQAAAVSHDRASQVGDRESAASPARREPRRDERLRRMVDAHYDFAWRCLRRMGVAEADTDDAAQEAFLIASRRLDDIAPDRERAFLFGTAYRLSATYRRKAFRRFERLDGAAAEHLDQGPNPEETLHWRRARERLDQVLESLSLEQRAVFVLFEFEQMTAPEIAALLEIPVGTVASRLRRAREIFCEALRRRRAADEFRRRPA
jgi:RNA polymerase sigma-70 factor (ECF subfamily)